MSPEVASLTAILSSHASTISAEVLQYVAAAVATVLCSVLSWAATKFVAWIEMKTHGTAIDFAGSAAESIVMGVEQEIVKSAREKCNDGKLSEVELHDIFATAKKTASDRFAAWVATLPKTVRPALEAKAQSLLEAALGKLKLNGLVMTSNPKPQIAANDVIPTVDPTPAPASK